MRVLCLGVAAVTLCLAQGCGQAPAQDLIRKPVGAGWHDPERIAEVRASSISESSGLALAGSEPGAFYTHNDSGDSARFFKFDSQGSLLATYSLAGAQATDWEDMAAARIHGTRFLYFGDIGDNQEARPSIRVYRVGEPEGNGGTISQYETYTLTYPDGPHNAEALMVHPATAELYIVTKTSSGPSKVYKARASSGSGAYGLAFVGEFTLPSNLPPGRLVTGGDIATNGRHVVVRTYIGAHEFVVPKRFDDWVKSAPSPITLAPEAQGEAICYSETAMALYTTSEGNPMPLNRVRRRE